MKCKCERCDGDGVIECPECCGDGWFQFQVEDWTPEKGHKHVKELVDLKLDVQRLKKQCQRLCELMPERSETYKEQLDAALKVVKAQAEKLYKDR
jgi:hypothetical protein